MSVSDPLLNDLKGCTRKLLEWTLPDATGVKHDIYDTCDGLAPLCVHVEEILHKGLLPRRTLFGYQSPEAWHWLEALADRTSIPYSFQSAGMIARKSTRTKTARGKLRLMIRTCLNNRCLHIPVEALLRSGDQFTVYQHAAILGDEILGEILLSVLLQISRLPFKLNLSNARFLDATWQLPAAAQHELVPCAAIGLSIAFVDNLPVVTKITQGSVAADTEQIEVGDVLDEINGVVLTSKSRGTLQNIMRKAAKKPILVNMVKLMDSDGCAYAPLMSMLKNSDVAADIDKAVKAKMRTKEGAYEEADKRIASCGKIHAEKRLRLGFTAFFVGKASTGKVGDIKCIELALELILAQKLDVLRQRVTVECQEIGVRIVEQKNSTVLLSHSYMEISACGQARKWPNHFAYIAGDNNSSCNRASSFTCYAFFSPSPKDIADLLISIGQGFTRTHFAV